VLKFIQKENLSALGFYPTKKRASEFISGLLLPGCYFAILYLTIAWLVKNPYMVNPHYPVRIFLFEIGFLWKSVWYEDLIFRGALLYILIKRIGPTKAVWISAVAFGIYHWFSWNAFGNPAQMLVIFITTGMAGYIFAKAFEITRSLYLPMALHFGVDFTMMVIFSQDKSMGKQLLIKSLAVDPHTPGTFVSILVLFFYYAGFFLLGLGYLWWLRKRNALMAKPPCHCTL